MDSSEIRHHIRHFLTDKSFHDMECAKQYLIPLRRTAMDGYTLIESRCLWFSLFLYKFRTDTNITHEVWTAARAFILETLRNDDHRRDAAQHFLSVFNEWKKQDHLSFVHEVIGYYLEVLHLKQTIEETKEENTIAEWKDSYQGLIIKIRDAAQRMGFLDQLDARVAEIDCVRHTLVENMMKRAYWDMVENDITQEKYTTVICQLLELKDLIKEVIPSRFHADLHDRFDIEFIQASLEQHTLDPEYLISLCRWVMDSMKEWDSAAARPLYDREIATWEESIGTLEWPRFLRFSLELCTLLALDAKTRVGIWRSLIRPKSE